MILPHTRVPERILERIENERKIMMELLFEIEYLTQKINTSSLSRIILDGESLEKMVEHVGEKLEQYRKASTYNVRNS